MGCRSDCKHTHRPAPVKHHIHHRGTDTISVPTRPAKRPSHLFLTPESNINNSVRYSTERPLFRPLSRERNQASTHSQDLINPTPTRSEAIQFVHPRDPLFYFHSPRCSHSCYCNEPNAVCLKPRLNFSSGVSYTQYIHGPPVQSIHNPQSNSTA